MNRRTFVVPNIPGGGANQTSDAVLFHVLRHIDANLGGWVGGWVRGEKGGFNALLDFGGWVGGWRVFFLSSF